MVRPKGPASPTVKSSLGPRVTAVTALSWLCWSGIFGLGMTLQLVPFQCWTSVWLSPPSLVTPTAQTLLFETAATPNNRLNVPRFGFGTTCHDVPSQCSMTASPPELPTAHTSLLESALMARSSL